jgi:hypothetical protein
MTPVRKMTLLAVVLAIRPLAAQQRADNDFTPHVAPPAFPAGHGPVIVIDEAHHNFHTASGRYSPFARLLSADGYVVRPGTQSFSSATLKDVRVLVVANALNERNDGNWTLPTPSAFTPNEIAAVKAWVEGGGAILLIADHMPFGGAAHDLAAALGFDFNNAYALDPTQERPGVIEFRRSDHTLAAHVITDGRNASERIDSIASFTGQGFLPVSAPDAVALMILRPTVVALRPETAGRLTNDTPRDPVGGSWQGAVRRLGKGRIGAFGEAAMFSAQTAARGGTMGMNAPVAGQNAQFVLNVLHWLSGLVDPASP